MLDKISYEIRNRLFSWRADNDGDLGIVIAGIVALVKYKEHTMVSFPWSENFPRNPAGKYQGCK